VIDPLFRESDTRNPDEALSNEPELDDFDFGDRPFDDSGTGDGDLSASARSSRWRVGLGRPIARWRRAWARWRRVRRWVLCAVVVLLLPVGWSYGRALTGPGSDSLQARTVEWGRDNHLGWAVDRIERWWFANHQAKIGGTPDLSAGPQVVAEPNATPRASTAPLSGAVETLPDPAAGQQVSTVPNATPVPATTPVAATAPPALPIAPGHLVPPGPLASPAAAAVAKEGQWAPFGPLVNGVQGAYVTSIRPDAIHTSVLDAVIWIDPTVLRLRQYPGLKIPGSPWDRPANVESARQSELVAAFSGGFRLKDSNGGMILGQQTLRAMRVGGATIAIDSNGMPNIGAWGTDISNSASLDSARQNLDPIVIDGAPAPDLATDANRKWGFTGPKNKTAVWRSGAGIRSDGSLVWVGGDGLTVESLAETLVRAGAVRGMQLDINQEWVQLNTYAVGADGTVHGHRLLQGMQHTGDRWLTADTRDFLAVFTR
jgi:hypothetical protein